MLLARTNLDVLDCLFESIIPEAIVQPESDELQRGLRTKRVFSRHVEVIHEVNKLLAANWYINTLIKNIKVQLAERIFLKTALSN